MSDFMNKITWAYVLAGGLWLLQEAVKFWRKVSELVEAIIVLVLVVAGYWVLSGVSVRALFFWCSLGHPGGFIC